MKRSIRSAVFLAAIQLFGTACGGQEMTPLELEEGTLTAAACAEWAEGNTYTAGQVVSYQGLSYTALVTHTAYVGTGWNPRDTPSLWTAGGNCGTPAFTVSLSASPSSITAAGSIGLTAQLSGGTGTKVEFYRGATLLSTDSNGADGWTASDAFSSSSQNGTYNYTAKAYTSSANATSSAVSVSVNIGGQPPPTTTIPKHALIGYWQNFNNGAKTLRIRDVPAAYDVIIVAFAEQTATPGQVTFAVDSGLSSALGGYSKADFISDIRAKQTAGKKVLLSIGGERGNVAVNSSATITAFVDSFHGLMNEYGFDGLDIDLENGIDTASMSTAARQLANRVGTSFVLTMAPQTLDVQQGGRYMPLINNTKDILTIVHTQYYNSGAMLGRDGKVYSQGSVDFITAQADLLLATLRADQVALGLPASTQGAGSGYVSPSVVNAALSCLALGTNCGSYKPVAKYASIRGVMDWSISWDGTSNWAFSNAVEPHLNSLP
ncbi:chitinase [Vitiosangium sp. GDMCC 1.1324]|uniref:chitinase n=1 Tax=Vitiosangium sp. (strain GDMCC 1.1324) TaxID=2138576 RepID=UPI00130DF634|nr:glycosyl hydrolase family 18 protein [Vitiosangium sp. GDMCC 1.1324]